MMLNREGGRYLEINFRILFVDCLGCCFQRWGGGFVTERSWIQVPPTPLDQVPVHTHGQWLRISNK